MSFEHSVKRLDEIIAQLERGELPLEKAVELYSEGVIAVGNCKKELDNAKIKLGVFDAQTGEYAEYQNSEVL